MIPRTTRAHPCRRRGPAQLALLALLVLFVGVTALAQQMEVIELRHRLAADVIPVLQPLVEPGGVITGTDAVLFVRTSPANLAQIRAALATLDRSPRQLVVTVGQGTVTSEERAGVSGSVVIGNDDVQVGVNAPPGAAPGATARIGSRNQRADLRNVGTVRTLEGTETFISVGQSVPLTTTQVTSGWGGSVVQQTTGFRDVSTGFYATPRVAGDVVTLVISPRQQRISGSRRAPVVETAGATTTVSGRLGEWMPLGAVRSSQGGDTGGLLVWGRHTSASEYSAWVKVEEVP
jgi:type II secretory pathway component GspD/PulD (secretin)